MGYIMKITEHYITSAVGPGRDNRIVRSIDLQSPGPCKK